MQSKDQPLRNNLAFKHSSGNVFADLGIENAEELLAKADLASAIARITDGRGWTQNETAKRAGLAQPDISSIRRGRLERFSLEHLQIVLRRLGVEVEIILHARQGDGIGTFRVREFT